ncbi:cytochrome c oxidase subunit 3 family protein [Patulibacter minatonensis]|uniref:cytochrome c oxidase subunit 3 family protein n=1 Tax=Patulibacter minatonensis TaxID=298163 RepID=UPI0004B5BBEF|nr:cytochrome c oxidase subunit 3 family protein [Patulibacter minatonensis]
MLGTDDEEVQPLPRPAVAAAPTAKDGPPSRWTSGHVPGEVGLWIFILGDMLVFGLFFGIFIVQRGDGLEEFRAGRETLSTEFGVANTVLLLTGSILVVLGMRAVRENRRRLASQLLLGAMATGTMFAIDKAIEWGEKFGDGLNPGTNDFYTLYFAFTGIHLVHLLIGMVALGVMVRLTRRPTPGEHDQALLESGATFWHLVDLLWLVLFPLFYLVA